MMEDAAEAEQEGGEPVNKSAAAAKKPTKKAKAAPVNRITKGFLVEESRVKKWDQLVAALKHSPANKRTGPQLIDEAIDDLCKKYAKDLT